MTDWTDQLAELAEPRGAGTPGDQRIRDRLAGILGSAGLEVREQPLVYQLTRVFFSLRAGFVLIALGLALGLVIPPGPLAWGSALLMTGVGLRLLHRVLTDDSLFVPQPDGARTTIRTANLVARIGPQDAARAVLLVAHHDSKSESLAIVARAGLLMIAAGGFLAAGIWSVAGFAGEEILWLRVVGSLGVAALIGLAANRPGNRSPGALDNAASLATVCQVARRLATAPPEENTSVEILLTGSEEHFLLGARRFLAVGGPEKGPRHTLVLNADGLGGPGPVGVVANGPLARWALGVGRAAGVDSRRVRLPPGAVTDALPFHRAGYRALTLTSGALSRGVFRVHTSRDRPDGVDPRVMEENAKMLEALVREAARAWP